MMRMVISVILGLYFCAFVSAFNISLNYPEQIILNESFTVSLSADTSETYDVKIYVQDENKTMLSEIENNGWKNPFFYVKGSFPKQTSFSISIIKYAQQAEICVRLRKTSSQSSLNPICRPITILAPSSLPPLLPSHQKDLENEKQVPTQVPSSTIINKTSSSSPANTLPNTDNRQEDSLPPLIPITDSSPIKEVDKLNGQSESENEGKIVLNQPKEKSHSLSTAVLITRRERMHLRAIYAFTLFVIIILILFAWKKL